MYEKENMSKLLYVQTPTPLCDSIPGSYFVHAFLHNFVLCAIKGKMLYPSFSVSSKRLKPVLYILRHGLSSSCQKVSMGRFWRHLQVAPNRLVGWTGEGHSAPAAVTRCNHNSHTGTTAGQWQVPSTQWRLTLQGMCDLDFTDSEMWKNGHHWTNEMLFVTGTKF